MSKKIDNLNKLKNKLKNELKNRDEIKKIDELKNTSFSALDTTQKIGDLTHTLKFDWTHPQDVVEQLRSEIIELEEAIPSNNLNELSHELGDIIFTALQLGRHLKISPTACLEVANKRFLSRLSYMLDDCEKNNVLFQELPSNEKERLWKQAKAFEKSNL